MKRALISCIVAMAIALSSLYAQSATLTIGTVSVPSSGSAVSVPITVQSFSNVGSISLSISYNSTILTFTGLANGPQGALSNASGGKINISWFSTSALAIADGGKLLDLQFTYNGGLSSGQSTPLTFVTSACEIANASGTVLTATYKNGVVGSGATGVEPAAEGTASGFQLSQNYPNPFNPATFIRYSVPKAGLVTLRVFDVLGNLAMEPVNQYQSAGSYVVRIEARALPSGMYIYQLRGGGMLAALRMVLEK